MVSFVLKNSDFIYRSKTLILGALSAKTINYENFTSQLRFQLKTNPDLTTSNLEFHNTHVLCCRITRTCHVIIIFKLRGLYEVVNVTKKFGQH